MRLLTNGSEYMYVLRYPEEKPVAQKGSEPWSIRQYALYHQIRIADRRSIFILISPMEDSAAEVCLETWMQNVAAQRNLHESCFAVNEVLLQRLSAWRMYLRYYEELIEDLVSGTEMIAWAVGRRLIDAAP